MVWGLNEPFSYWARYDLRMNSMGSYLTVKLCFTVKNHMEISSILKRIT